MQWPRQKLFRWSFWLGIYLLPLLAWIGYVWYERSRPLVLPPSRQTILKANEPDSLVIIPKFRVVDLEDARKLKGQTLWVKAGFESPFFPCKPEARTIRESDPLLLPPATPVQVLDVFEIPRQGIFLAIEHEGIPHATQVAWLDLKNHIYFFQMDTLFYPGDPLQYFPHWDSRTRSLVKTHQIRKEMTYAQTVLALGAGQLLRILDQDTHVYQFPSRPGAQPGATEVHFRQGKISSFRIVEPPGVNLFPGSGKNGK
jgi:hypothetical protein